MDQDNPFATEDITPPFNKEWEAKRRVAEAIKQLTDVLVTSSPSTKKMHLIAEQLEQTTAEFSGAPRIYGRLDWASTGDHGSFGQISHELSPLSGWSNPLAPPVNSWFEKDKALATCHCGWAHEGPPGSVHGGIVASIFDQFLGVAQLLGGQPGMTGYLHVNYHARTPLNTELRLEGSLDRCEGRKTFMRGEMYADDVLTASAVGLFIQPRGGMDAIKTHVKALRSAAL